MVDSLHLISLEGNPKCICFLYGTEINKNRQVRRIEFMACIMTKICEKNYPSVTDRKLLPLPHRVPDLHQANVKL